MYFKIIPQDILETPPPSDAYFRQAWEFCRLWALGEQAFVLHTSGSTGVPKPISLLRAQMQASAQLTQQALELKSDYKALVCLNVAYIAGIMMLVRGMEIGMEMYVVAPSSSPLDAIPEEISLDFGAFVPLQLQTMLAANQKKRLNTFQTIIVGGAAVSPSLLGEIDELEVPVYSTYGMTETVSHIALKRLNGTSASGFYELLEGIDIDLDARGCLKICGSVTNHEWIQTNDVVNLKTSRVFEMIGRADNIINSGGLKIQLEKVEQAIGSFWEGKERYFAWWKPDERLGQKLILIFETTQEVSLDWIKTRLNALLKPYEIPKEIWTIEKFAETPTGKVDKQATFAILP